MSDPKRVGSNYRLTNFGLQMRAQQRRAAEQAAEARRQREEAQRRYFEEMARARRQREEEELILEEDEDAEREALAESAGVAAASSAQVAQMLENSEMLDLSGLQQPRVPSPLGGPVDLGDLEAHPMHFEVIGLPAPFDVEEFPELRAVASSSSSTSPPTPPSPPSIPQGVSSAGGIEGDEDEKEPSEETSPQEVFDEALRRVRTTEELDDLLVTFLPKGIRALDFSLVSAQGLAVDAGLDRKGLPFLRDPRGKPLILKGFEVLRKYQENIRVLDVGEVRLTPSVMELFTSLEEVCLNVAYLTRGIFKGSTRSLRRLQVRDPPDWRGVEADEELPRLTHLAFERTVGFTVAALLDAFRRCPELTHLRVPLFGELATLKLPERVRTVCIYDAHFATAEVLRFVVLNGHIERLRLWNEVVFEGDSLQRLRERALRPPPPPPLPSAVINRILGMLNAPDRVKMGEVSPMWNRAVKAEASVPQLKRNVLFDRSFHGTPVPSHLHFDSYLRANPGINALRITWYAMRTPELQERILNLAPGLVAIYLDAPPSGMLDQFLTDLRPRLRSLEHLWLGESNFVAYQAGRIGETYHTIVAINRFLEAVAPKLKTLILPGDLVEAHMTQVQFPRLEFLGIQDSHFNPRWNGVLPELRVRTLLLPTLPRQVNELNDRGLPNGFLQNAFMETLPRFQPEMAPGARSIIAYPAEYHVYDGRFRYPDSRMPHPQADARTRVLRALPRAGSAVDVIAALCPAFFFLTSIRKTE